MPMKIISGGQTGADRAALDAAMGLGVPVGGSCPAGRQAEDGPIDERYPLQVITGGYRQRTRKNVEDADASVIFYSGMPTGGTALTIGFCIKSKRPFKLFDRELVPAELASASLRKFMKEHNVKVLNVAGPRASGDPDVYDYTFKVITGLLPMR
ncbi:MAG TPA: putative molybdenum carrier protein [Gammaproteobacteria bacterium]